MDVNTIRQAAAPSVGSVRFARSSKPELRSDAPRPSPARDSVSLDALSDQRAPSPAVEGLLERRVANTARGIRLQVDESIDRVIAQIVNESNEVIKQIPPEEAVRFFMRYREVTGLIFDLEI